MYLQTDVHLHEISQGLDHGHLRTIHIRTVSILLYATKKIQSIQKNKYVNVWLFQKDVTTVERKGTFEDNVEKEEEDTEKGR